MSSMARASSATLAGPSRKATLGNSTASFMWSPSAVARGALDSPLSSRCRPGGRRSGQDEALVAVGRARGDPSAVARLAAVVGDVADLVAPLEVGVEAGEPRLRP